MGAHRLAIDIETLRGILRDRDAAVLLYDRSGRLLPDQEHANLGTLVPARVGDVIAGAKLLLKQESSQVWACEIEPGQTSYLVVDRNPANPHPSMLIIASTTGSEGRILNGLPIAILNLNAHFDVVYANNRAELYLGAATGELDGSGWQKFFAPQNLEGLIAHFRNPATASQPYRQTMVLSRDGIAPRHFDVTAVGQWRGTQGTVSYCLSLVDRAQEYPLPEEQERVAAQDALTHLMNRQSLLAAVDGLPPGELQSLGVASIDLDDFASLNEALGYAAGDELLRIVALRLRSAVRDTDFIARTGGDSMLIVCRQVGTEEQLRALGGKLSALLNDTVSLRGNDAKVAASVGLAHASRCHHDGEDRAQTSLAERLAEKSDAALRLAKAEGKAQFQIFDDSLPVRAAELKAQRWEFQQVLDNDAITCVFQPIRDHAGTMSVEALARITMTLNAHASIQDLIETAKRGQHAQTFLNELTRRALRVFGAYVQDHAYARPELRGLTLNLNIDMLQLTGETFVDDLLTWTRDASLSPQQLCLEISETDLEGGTVDLLGVLQRLRDAGMRLSMTGFGSGDSSLKRLLVYEFDQVKVDRAFLDKAQTSGKYRALLAAMVTMGESASIEMLAEGIESHDEEDLCRHAGVNLLQGFRLARPAPLEELFTAPAFAILDDAGPADTVRPLGDPAA